MFYRKDAAVALALSTLLACTGFAAASTPSSAPVVSLDAAVADTLPQGLLMQGLDKIGAAKPLDAIGLNVYGFIEAGYIFNPNRSDGEGNMGRVFDYNNKNNVLLNQVDLTFERVIADPKKFDVGGKLEVIYGTDARYVHAYGENFYAGASIDSPYAQFDFVQYYVDVNVPVGNGLGLRVGKFVTLMGMETINPTTNAFYTHSFLFNFGIPFTNSGILGSYNLNDQWSAKFGIARGDDISMWKDNNGSVNLLGQIGFAPTKELQMFLNLDAGPSMFDDNSDWSQIYNFVAVYKVNDKMSLGFDGVIGGQAFNDNTSSGNWYGIALYGGYVINDYMTANVRTEWFMDRFSDLDNSRTGPIASTVDPNLNGLGNIGNIPGFTRKQENLWEVTLGVTITPMPADKIGKNLKIRPEVRYDAADDMIFSGGSDSHQVTFAADVIFTF